MHVIGLDPQDPHNLIGAGRSARPARNGSRSAKAKLPENPAPARCSTVRPAAVAFEHVLHERVLAGVRGLHRRDGHCLLRLPRPGRRRSPPGAADERDLPVLEVAANEPRRIGQQIVHLQDWRPLFGPARQSSPGAGGDGAALRSARRDRWRRPSCRPGRCSRSQRLVILQRLLGDDDAHAVMLDVQRQHEVGRPRLDLSPDSSRVRPSRMAAGLRPRRAGT